MSMLTMSLLKVKMAMGFLTEATTALPAAPAATRRALTLELKFGLHFCKTMDLTATEFAKDTVLGKTSLLFCFILRKIPRNEQ